MPLRHDTRATRSQRPAWAAPWPDTSAPATTPPADRSAENPRRARLVTYGVVLTLLLTAAVEAEIWPLTAYRLFSGVRTDTTTTLELVASTAAGDVVVAPADPSQPLVTTALQYRDLPAATPDRRHDMVLAWLDLAEIDVADVSVVRLERTVRTLPPGSDQWAEQSRKTLVEVTP